ncbi:MAG TPA: hypothetical protein VMV78_04450, partial [Thiobacillus sp.]|nr:hypothetical protein [Thiobacillus sp.]
LIGRPASASRRNPMIRSSVKRFFMSNLLRQWDWTLKLRATQTGGTSLRANPLQQAHPAAGLSLGVADGCVK